MTNEQWEAIKAEWDMDDYMYQRDRNWDYTGDVELQIEECWSIYNEFMRPIGQPYKV